MRAYYFDDEPTDQRLPHDSGEEVSLDTLDQLGVLYWSIPVAEGESIPSGVDAIAKERGYKNRDVINVSKEGLGDLYETKIKSFFEEHMHEDEEIRYILGGSGFFDVRKHAPHPNQERWIRILCEQGDLLVLPSGIYHRFTLDTNNKIKAARLFQDEPKWIPHNRGPQTDVNPYRADYLSAIQPISVA
ncbi:1,2-dihydroxy-3-keto-5-methylthiopentene dioxygenase [Calocera viscosa TUFC12733]|uniref:Acireductone dioxygenase n=1 Tax=Calocera viscosa (strain TUFC12733) TaxID=1330018 RepID=A0A167RYF3_CALVF|nr:1,2-dihydroxy-3-keto-5-methylthiopentene dioxygenase [Calocera viscosa TUFC12733]